MPLLEQSTEKSPENLAVIKQLLTLYRNGLNQPDTIGYHGCSLETFEYALTNTVIPGSTADDPAAPKGALFFAATTDDASRKLLNDMVHKKFETFHTPESALNQATKFAQSGAHKYRLLAFLDLDRTNSMHHDGAIYIVDNHQQGRRERRKYASELFTSEGITIQQLAQALQAARKRRGIIIGVKRKLVEDFPVIHAHSLKDYGVVNPYGYALEYFTGLRCEGPEEEAFFQDLERQYGYLLDKAYE